MTEGAQEQHFILRVQDAELASKLRGWLRDSDKPSDKIGEIRLLFEQRKQALRSTPAPEHTSTPPPQQHHSTTAAPCMGAGSLLLSCRRHTFSSTSLLC
jgi:hypothetical protein